MAEYSPAPDDDICEQESEDWTEMLDSVSTDNFQSSSRVIPIKKPTPKKDGSQAWKGIPIKIMKKMPDCEEKLGPLKGSESHVVLFQTPYEYREQNPPKPYLQYKDKWDHYHVRMPCSSQNEFPVQEKHGKKIARRWDIITRNLSRDIKDIGELESAIISYNHRYYDKWNLETLYYFFTQDLEEQECHEFFSKTMRKMQKLALNLPDLCSCPIPLLKKGQSKSVTFSQQQIASLLANAFFCTFPQRNTKQRFSELSKFPSINFSSLFTGKPDSVKMEKLRCILHYFTRVCEKTPCGTVTFTRLHNSESPDWDKMETHLSGLHVSSEGTIEDDGEGMLQVDFANKFVGGGVLDNDCQQEEIRFLICPEMIISRLITEELDYNEALVMRGCERFSDYDGYSSTFKWKRPYTDETPRDKWGRIYCEVVAIDALVFRNYKSQFQHRYVRIELSKAYCGFFRMLPVEHLPAVCTGNWGCGAFGGDSRLKALIQLMAAALAKRDVCYFTLNDEKLRDDLHHIHSYLTRTNPLCIGDLLKIIELYRKNVIHKSQAKPDMNIFEFILRTFEGSLENTDEDSLSSNEVRYQKESGSESSCSSKGSTDGVAVNIDLESETSTLPSHRTSKSYARRVAADGVTMNIDWESGTTTLPSHRTSKSCARRVAADVVTLDADWKSESPTLSSQSTSRNSPSRQNSLETQIQKLDVSTAKSQKGLALPSHWDPLRVTDVVSVVLDPNDRKQTIRDEYAKVAKHFGKSMTNAEIKSIKRVQNALLWEHYALEQESEDWTEMLDSERTDNFQSSSRVIPIMKPTPKKDGSQAWKGIPIKVMKKMPDCEEKLGPLKGSESHVVLFQTPYEYKEKSPPKPYAQYKDKWDHYHVRMPCSSQNEFPVQEKHGKKIARRWDIITRNLSRDIKDIGELESAIISYNYRYYDKWDLETLYYFFTQDLEEQECREFFSKTMKKMQKLAMNLPDLCSYPIPLLKKGQSKSVTFSQQQIASLLANAFFCTFPQQFSDDTKFSSINFSSLFTGKPDSVKMEKLRCILHYFTRVCEKTPCGTVTFTRLHNSESPDWDKMETHLSGLHVSSEGTIEDDGEGMLQVDFANKFVGGGVLDNDCQQEEIRFLICPEMIISRLITEELDYNEALVMRGCERFSDYDGYSSTFKWKRPYTDETPRDKWGRIYCEVVAIDALVFRNYKSQFQHRYVRIELSKAYCGFFRMLPVEHLPAVCTGNWGCGAFGGDSRLKALIQLMAAALARRDVCYFTLNDEKLRDDLHHIHSYLTITNPLSIGDILKIIEQYRKNVILKSQAKPEMNIFEFILRTFDGSLENTDEDSLSSNEVRHQKESGSKSSCSSKGSTDRVTVNIDLESETPTLSSQSTSRNSPSRQNSQETQIQKLDVSTAKSTAKSQKGLALPSHWDPMRVTDVVSVVLDPNDRKQTIRDEYAKVAKHFGKSMTNAEIKSIKRVQNALLWEHYALRKKEMEGKAGVGCVSEMRLYHGTTPDTVELICEENFDFRIAGSRVGALYGQGTYFALEAKFSDCYAHVDDNNHKFMFVAQVLVSKICLGKAEYKKPPYLDEGDKRKGTYDTCVNNVDRPSVFCVFDRNQYYPEYIIEYEK